MANARAAELAKYTAYIYVMGFPEGGPCKIGYAMEPTKRVKQIAKKEGRHVIVTGTWPVGRAIALATERYVHWVLRDHHFRGEWFSAPMETVVAAVEQALANGAYMDRYSTVPPVGQPHGDLGYGEHLPTKFPTGTRDAIAAVLNEGETRSAFIRSAIDAELRKRERGKP